MEVEQTPWNRLLAVFHLFQYHVNDEESTKHIHDFLLIFFLFSSLLYFLCFLCLSSCLFCIPQIEEHINSKLGTRNNLKTDTLDHMLCDHDGVIKTHRSVQIYNNSKNYYAKTEKIQKKERKKQDMRKIKDTPKGMA